MTEAKVKEINEKEWFKVLTSQYKLLFREKEKIKKPEVLNMNTEYPLLLDFTNKVLNKLKDQQTQYSINGEQNLWIVKPGHQSRGRGITVLTKYNEILKYIKEGKGRHWVVQKYIENPLIINKKKFDIRQWVLVTDWNPLTVFIYKECYIRFAVQDFDPKSTSKFAHLTNNCIAHQFNKHSPGKSPTKKKRDLSEAAGEEEADEEEDAAENIWSLDDFKSHLNTEFGDKHPDQTDIFDSLIFP